MLGLINSSQRYAHEISNIKTTKNHTVSKNLYIGNLEHLSSCPNIFHPVLWIKIDRSPLLGLLLFRVCNLQSLPKNMLATPFLNTARTMFGAFRKPFSKHSSISRGAICRLYNEQFWPLLAEYSALLTLVTFLLTWNWIWCQVDTYCKTTRIWAKPTLSKSLLMWYRDICWIFDFFKIYMSYVCRIKSMCNSEKNCFAWLARLEDSGCPTISMLDTQHYFYF